MCIKNDISLNMIKHDLKHEKVIHEHFKIKFKTQNTENHDMKKWIHVYSNIGLKKLHSLEVTVKLK